MPFMPQMFQYCGKRLKVFKRAHKSCDTIAIKWDYPGRSIADGIHLNLRCDGQAYGGCQAACLIFWKEQWLKPAPGAAGQPESLTPTGRRDTKQRLHGRRRQQSDARAEFEPWRRTGLYLPGHSISRLRQAASVVGFQAISRGLYVGQRVVLANCAWHDLRLLLLPNAFIQPEIRRPRPLGLRSIPVSLGRPPLPPASGKTSVRPARTIGHAQPSTGRTCAHQVV